MRRLAAPFGLVAVAFALAPRSPAAGQDEPEPLAAAVSGLTFREIGPAVMGGRVSDLAIHASDPQTWYVGLASGGLWKTTNHGMSWTPLFDAQPVSSIGAVSVAPSNPHVVWVGTGEPQNRQSSPYGYGVFRSLDGGATWEPRGLEETRHVGRVVIHPTDPDIVYVAAVGHLWGPNEERGVYRTTDGGESWEKVLYLDEDTGAIDLVMDPRDPGTLFAALYQRRRTAFGFSASGAGSGIWRTHDAGQSWTALSEGLPEGDKGRIGLAVHARDGRLVYASVEGAGEEARGLYRSTDRGATWERLSDNNPRPMYFSLVRLDPTNPERVYMGGVDLQVSDDGGRTWWDRDGARGIHVDHHALWIDPNDSDHVVLGNDGGVASSWDGALTWRHHDNLAIGQFYEIGVDMRDPYRVCGGLQDNSSWCGPSRTLDGYGIGNDDWYDVSGGDGFYNQIDPTDWRIVYTESQGGNVRRVNVETGESSRIRPVYREEDEDTSAAVLEAAAAAEVEAEAVAGAVAGEIGQTAAAEGYEFNWNSPIVVSSHDPSTVYLGSNRLMRSRDRGQTWEEASPDLTRRIDRDTLEIFDRALAEPHLSRNDGVGAYGTLTTIDESPLDPTVIWVGTDDGHVQVTRDGGATWTEVGGNIDALPGRRYVSRVEASAHAPGRAYAAFDGHYDDEYRPWVFVTEDFGASWRSIAEGLPDHSVNVVREHPRAERLLFVGNEIGAWVSLDRGAAWHRLGGGLPTVPVDDMVIHPRDNDLVLGTHGRSIWIADDVTPLETLSAEVAARAAHLFPVRPATLHEELGGWPFHGDRWFGANPPAGALVRYHLAAELDLEAVALVVTDAAGDTVRHLKGPTSAGLHTVAWDLRHDPPYEPEEGEEGGFFGPPAGPTVLPGRYHVRLETAGLAMEEPVEVRLDPRVETTRTALEQRQRALLDAHGLLRGLDGAQRRVRRLSELLDDVHALTDEREDVTDTLRARVDSLRTRLEDVGEALGDLGGAGRAGAAAGSSFGPPTADQRWQLDRAWEDLPGTIEDLNDLVTRDIPALYRELDRLGVRPDPGEPLEVPRRPGG
jgi:photosystem II stability/assembly factor-like uncharacterized protein